MTVLTLVLLGLTAAVGGALWRLIEPGRTQRRDLLLILVVPLLLLATAAAAALAASGSATGFARYAAVVIGTLAAVTAGGPITIAVLRMAEPGAMLQGDQPTVESPAAAVVVLRNGAWIGILERLASIITVLAGWPEGIAIVLAVKGIGRYPELKLPSAPERFIIGTFCSVLWALGCAGVVLTLVGS